MHCSLLWLIYQSGDQYLPSIHSQNSSPQQVLYIPLFCFVFNCLSCSACILQMRNKPNQFLIQIKVYFFIIIYSFIFYFFFLLIKQLFSHETVKVSRLFCLFVLFLELKLQGNNPQLHYFSPVPKRFTMFFIYFHFNIILHFILKFTLLFYHSFFYGFVLTVTSEQNVFVTPYLGFFLVQFIGNGLELC